MTISEDFTSTLARLAVGEMANSGMLPALLAQTCVQTLGVDGASISLMNDTVRMPLGADSPVSAVAEHLQFTLGEGPCMLSYRTGLTATFTQTELDEQWPEYGRRLQGETPYRSCVGLPLTLGPTLVAALDLYLIDPRGLSGAAIANAQSIALEVTQVLLTDLAASASEPEWLHGDTMRERANLWVVIGMLTPASTYTAVEITALIRAYAFAHSRPFDEVTHALVDGSLTPDVILTG